MVDGGGLENRCTRKGTGGSNPSPSASFRSLPLAYWRRETFPGIKHRASLFGSNPSPPPQERYFNMSCVRTTLPDAGARSVSRALLNELTLTSGMASRSTKKFALA